MKKAFFFLVCFGSYMLPAVAQTEYPTETERYIFWQPGKRLTASDFLKDISDSTTNSPASQEIQLMKQLGVGAAASVGLFSILDIPKMKQDRKNLPEKTYIVAVFDKKQSTLFDSSDSTAIAREQIAFDLYEVAARLMRKTVAEYRDSKSAIGSGGSALMLTKIEAAVIKKRQELIDQYVLDVYINKTHGAFEKWKALVDRLLKDYDAFASSPEESGRFIGKIPLDNRYKEFQQLGGALFL